jgi:hypothetical protein
VLLENPTLGGGSDKWDRSPSADDLGANNGHTGDLACNSQSPDPQEAVVSATVISIVELDCDIAVAVLALGVARRSWERCPSGENAALVDQAEGSVDRLLEQRFAARQ